MVKETKYVGYCVRCKAKKEMKEVKIGKMKNGMGVAKGLCVTCGCKMCKILGKS